MTLGCLRFLPVAFPLIRPPNNRPSSHLKTLSVNLTITWTKCYHEKSPLNILNPPQAASFSCPCNADIQSYDPHSQICLCMGDDATLSRSNIL